MISLDSENTFIEKHHPMEQQKSMRWYKWIRTLGIVIIFLNLLIYLLILFDDTNGKKIQYDQNHSIYYSEEYFDPSYVRRVGDGLKEIGYFVQNSTSDIQLLRSLELGDTVVVGYIVDPSNLNPEIKNSFKEITKLLYPLLRTHTKIYLRDKKFKTVYQITLD